MTIADRQHTATLSRLAAAAVPALRWLTVRWEVCDGELRGVLEWRILDDHGPRRGGAPAALAIWHPAASADASNGSPGVVVATLAASEARAIVRCRDGAGLEHLDIPGLLALTIRRDPGAAATVLYARTPLIARLGARGGRTDFPAGAIIHTAHDTSDIHSGRP